MNTDQPRTSSPPSTERQNFAEATVKAGGCSAGLKISNITVLTAITILLGLAILLCFILTLMNKITGSQFLFVLLIGALCFPFYLKVIAGKSIKEVLPFLTLHFAFSY